MQQGTQAPPQYSPEFLTVAINNEHRKLIAKMSEGHNRYFLKFKDYKINNTTRQEEYLPDDCFMRISVVPVDSQTGRPLGDPIKRINTADTYTRWTGYLIRGNKIEFWNLGSFSGSIRLYYEHTIPDLCCGIATMSGDDMILSSNPTDDSVDTLVNGGTLKGAGATSRRNDYYNDAEIMIVSALTNGDRQIARIADYTGNTRTLSVEEWPVGTPSGDVDDPIVYSILPVIPEEFQQLLVFGGWMGIADPNYYAKARLYYDELYERFVSFLDNEDKSTPIRVLNADGEHYPGATVPYPGYVNFGNYFP